MPLPNLTVLPQRHIVPSSFTCSVSGRMTRSWSFGTRHDLRTLRKKPTGGTPASVALGQEGPPLTPLPKYLMGAVAANRRKERQTALIMPPPSLTHRGREYADQAPRRPLHHPLSGQLAVGPIHRNLDKWKVGGKSSPGISMFTRRIRVNSSGKP
jgi:hypothetical protein